MSAGFKPRQFPELVLLVYLVTSQICILVQIHYQCLQIKYKISKSMKVGFNQYNVSNNLDIDDASLLTLTFYCLVYQ